MIEIRTHKTPNGLYNGIISAKYRTGTHLIAYAVNCPNRYQARKVVTDMVKDIETSDFRTWHRNNLPKTKVIDYRRSI